MPPFKTWFMDKRRDGKEDPTMTTVTRTEFEMLVEMIRELKEEVHGTRDNQEALSKTVALIQADLVRYRGFVGGVSFVMACAMTIWTMLKDWLVEQFKS